MRFVYLLHEWEGSATNSRVLRDLGITTSVAVDIPTLRVFSHPTEDSLKKRFDILRSPTFYPIKAQVRFIMACFLLHNFIRFEMPTDPLEQLVDETGLKIHVKI
ncbi:hypothetical protein ACS0TY_021070 [Phlomoides rotata]